MKGHDRGAIDVSVHDSAKGLAQQVGPDVGLGEEAGPDPGTEFPCALVRPPGDLDVGHRQVLPPGIRAARGEQAPAVALPRTVGAKDAPPVPEPDIRGARAL